MNSIYGNNCHSRTCARAVALNVDCWVCWMTQPRDTAKLPEAAAAAAADADAAAAVAGLLPSDVAV